MTKNQFVGTLAPNTVQEITPNLTIVMDSKFSATETTLHQPIGNKFKIPEDDFRGRNCSHGTTYF